MCKSKSSFNCQKYISNRSFKAGSSDPIFFHGQNIAQQIKGTLGITGLYFFRVPIEKSVWHLDVGLMFPIGAEANKGLTVRQLKHYMNWVQNVVKQFGLYLLTP